MSNFLERLRLERSMRKGKEIDRKATRRREEDQEKQQQRLEKARRLERESMNWDILNAIGVEQIVKDLVGAGLGYKKSPFNSRIDYVENSVSHGPDFRDEYSISQRAFSGFRLKKSGRNRAHETFIGIDMDLPDGPIYLGIGNNHLDDSGKFETTVAGHIYNIKISQEEALMIPQDSDLAQKYRQKLENAVSHYASTFSSRG